MARTRSAIVGASGQPVGAETGLTKNQVISQLCKASHGDLEQYRPVGEKAAHEDPEFFAHLIAWNQQKGTVRDSKTALPVVHLSALKFEPGTGVMKTLKDNAVAHLALLSPRDLLKALRFAEGKAAYYQLARLVKRYLKARESNVGWFERTVLSHRKSILTLYKYTRMRPGAYARAILFEGQYPENSVFGALASLGKVTPEQAAADIINYRLPFLNVMGALGANRTNPAVGMALIERMSPTELVTNTKLLTAIGLQSDPAMRAAYEEKLQKVATSQKGVPLKTGRAAKVLKADAGVTEAVVAKLQAVQEKQLDTMSVKGDWFVMIDKSGSMQTAIESGKMVSAVLARVAEGKTIMGFFDTAPRLIDATGHTYETIQKATSLIIANGGTSIGCALQALMDNGVEVDGVAVVSDAQENRTPFFTEVYARYCEKAGKEIPVYLYRVGPHYNQYSGDLDLAKSMKMAGYDLQEFDLRNQTVDYTSLPNLVLTMRTNRYSLVQEIMDTPLLTLDQVFRTPPPVVEIV